MNTGSQNGRIEQAHLNEEWIRKYQSRSLAAEELEAAGRHLNDCGACRRVLLASMGAVRLPEELAELPEPLHLSYEQITAYIDGKLAGADKERVETHSFICGSCSREIADLRKLDALLAEPESEVKTEPSRVSVWERMAQAFRMPGAMPKFGLALGAIVVGFFLLSPRGQTGGNWSPHYDWFRGMGAGAHEVLHLGAYALIIGGVVYIAYRLLGRR
jgi:hypothetical protein